MVSVLINPYLYFSVNWLPTYFAQQRGLSPGKQLAWILTAIYLGLDLNNLLCGASGAHPPRQSAAGGAPDRIAGGLAPLVAARLCRYFRAEPGGLRSGGREYRLGVWVAMYLTMIQDVSNTRLDRSGIGKRLRFAGRRIGDVGVGKVTHQTGSFAIPMVAFSSPRVSAVRYAASRELPEPEVVIA